MILTPTLMGQQDTTFLPPNIHMVLLLLILLILLLILLILLLILLKLLLILLKLLLLSPLLLLLLLLLWRRRVSSTGTGKDPVITCVDQSYHCLWKKALVHLFPPQGMFGTL